MADVPVNPSDASTVVVVTSNGQVAFDYDFRADKVEDLKALYTAADGTETLLVGGVNFIASGLGTAAGGTVALTTFTATVTGDTLTIYRDIEISRTTDYSRDLFAEDLNAEQDRIFMILQEQKRDVDRSVKVGIGEDPISITPGTGGQIPVFDEDGNLIPGAPAGGGNMLREVYDPRSIGADAFNPANHSGAFWDSGVSKTMKERGRWVANLLEWDADPTGVSDSTAALKAMIAEGVACELPKGKFVTLEPLLMKTTGQRLRGQGRGFGYGRPDYFARYWEHMSTIVGAGSFARRVMTRRNHRASAADPTDAPMSCILERHADGIILEDFAIELNTDWSNLSASNYGDDIDMALFRDGRPGNIVSRVAILGSFRKTAILDSFTRALNLPELLDPDGNPLPEGASGATMAGGDVWGYDNVLTFGMCSGLTIYGAKHPGGDYYDEATGLVSDGRGASGNSSGRITGMPVFWVTHPSGQRKVDPTGYGAPLTRANMEAEPDFTPAGIDIDGWAGNSATTTTGLGQVRNVKFDASRVASIGPFRVRIRNGDQVHFSPPFWNEAGDAPQATGIYKDTAGNPINVSDYANVTYGHLATSAVTGQVTAPDAVGGLNQSWVYSKQKLRASDAYGREMMQGLWVRGDTSIALPSGMAALDHVYDDGAASEYGGRVTESFRPFEYLVDRSSGKGAGFRYDTNVWRYSYGTFTPGSTLPNVGYEHNEVRFDFRQPVKLPSYTVATLPDAVASGAGAEVWCTNGRAGQPCVAVSTGSGWFVVGSYGAVSAS